MHFEMEEGQYSGSDIFLSADSDNGDLADGNEGRDTKDVVIDIAAKELIASKMKDMPQKGDVQQMDSLKVDTPQRGKNDKGEDNKSDNVSFNEFVKYEENGDKSESSETTPQNSPQKSCVSGGAETLMQACILAYQRLFHTILSTRIVPDKITTQYLLQQLLVTKPQRDDFPRHLALQV